MIFSPAAVRPSSVALPRWGRAKTLGSVGSRGSIAAVVVFLVWIYLSAVILLYGGEVTSA